MAKSRYMVGFCAALATTGLLVTGTAQAAQSANCLTPAEAQEIAVAAFPDALASARQACVAHLPATSALVQTSARIAEVYKPAAEKAWPGASCAFLATADIPLPPGANPAFVRPLLTTVVTSMIVQEIKPTECSAFDEFYDALAPLPPENIGKLLVAIMKMDSASKKPGAASVNPFTICEATTR